MSYHEDMGFIRYVFHDEADKQLSLATRVRRIHYDIYKRPICSLKLYRAFTPDTPYLCGGVHRY